MELSVQDLDDVAVVELPVEELDAGNANDLKRDVEPILERHTKVVFDLGRVRFIDSSGLGAVLSSLRRTTAKGGDLKLCCLSPHVRSVFELVRMHRIFEIFDTREAAVGAFRSPAQGTPNAA